MIQVTMQVDFGKDLGQSFGSLFEVRDSRGRVIAGAGFADVYNTMFRNDRSTLQFFVRPDTEDNQFTLERLPRPTTDCGTYLFDMDGKLYARSYINDQTLRRWNEATKSWDEDLTLDPPMIRVGDGEMRVGEGILQFTERSVRYNGETILQLPEKGGYHNFYYANGHLIFYHTNAGKDGFNRLCAVPWTANSKGTVDMPQARMIDLKYPTETGIAFGQYHQQVVVTSNNGGVYLFEAGNWKTLREANNQVSFQVYSSVNYHDRLLLSQYPTGNLFEYDGVDLKFREGWPPVIEGVAKSSREAQTTMIYGGDLFVGVWPWAELWRLSQESREWISMGRLFTHPPLTDTVQHPFEQEIRDFNAANTANEVSNNWGQRVTSMVVLGDSLYLSTSAKGPWKRDPRFAFLTDEVYQEYGQVVRLKRPGNLAATMQPSDKPTELKFILTRDTMTILQDGKQLASAKFDSKLTTDLKPESIAWGKGVFGTLQGKMHSKAVKPAI